MAVPDRYTGRNVNKSLLRIEQEGGNASTKVLELGHSLLTLLFKYYHLKKERFSKKYDEMLGLGYDLKDEIFDRCLLDRSSLVVKNTNKLILFIHDSRILFVYISE